MHANHPVFIRIQVLLPLKNLHSLQFPLFLNKPHTTSVVGEMTPGRLSCITGQPVPPVV